MRQYPRGCHVALLRDWDSQPTKITQPVTYFTALQGMGVYPRATIPVAVRPRGRMKWTVFIGDKPVDTGRDLDVLRMKYTLLS